MNKTLKFGGLLAAAMALNACASMNVFKDSGTDQAAVAPPVTAPATPGVPGVLSAAQIKTLLTGKSWRWKGPKNAGVTLYASDGTSLVEVTGKGTTQGKWEAKDGQLCESFSPAPFLPQGVPMTCQPFTGSAGNYMVGQATFNLAS
ncbi:MAG: hypothetical protein KGO53_12485 [Alphaproteobacteria bacterium]|nr:hypothetical protein [Alphaproteobacteria bacterium]